MLLYHFDGFVDAGARAPRHGHLLAELEHRVIVTFDLTACSTTGHDGPIMIFDTDRWIDCRQPRLAIHLVHDLDGHAVPGA